VLTPSAPDPARRTASLIDVDPDLGQFLDPDRLAEARRTIGVQVRKLPKGPWNTGRLSIADAGHIGLLLLDGLLTREVLTSDIVSTELLGPGEILRPWSLVDSNELLQAHVRWSVIADARVAVLNHRAADQLVRYPEIYSVLVERLNARAQRLAVAQAISQLNRVDERLLALFWHLAERWGRVTPRGLHLSLTLSHRMLSQLIGARRPTVSTALGDLTRRGEVQRLGDGSWLLTGEPVGTPAESTERFVPPRRRLFAGGRSEVTSLVPPSGPVAAAPEPPGQARELLARLERVRAECERTRLQCESGVATAAALARTTAEQCARMGRLREAGEARRGRPAA
jgi:CRP/FNR family cyclic AMP-dependent transcriptional regulator